MAKDLMKVASKPAFARNKFLREKKDRKRKEAAERQAAYDALTLEQKLAKLGDRPAVKQRAKLAGAAAAEVFLKTGISQIDGSDRSLAAEITEGFEALASERKGKKARRQAKKDKKAK